MDNIYLVNKMETKQTKQKQLKILRKKKQETRSKDDCWKLGRPNPGIINQSIGLEQVISIVEASNSTCQLNLDAQFLRNPIEESIFNL